VCQLLSDREQLEPNGDRVADEEERVRDCEKKQNEQKPEQLTHFNPFDATR